MTSIDQKTNIKLPIVISLITAAIAIVYAWSNSNNEIKEYSQSVNRNTQDIADHEDRIRSMESAVSELKFIRSDVSDIKDLLKKSNE